MSTRSRAAPWFLDRPAYYRRTEDYVANNRVVAKAVAWSWDAITWFAAEDGQPLYVGTGSEYGEPAHGVLERELQAQADAYRDWSLPA